MVHGSWFMVQGSKFMEPFGFICFANFFLPQRTKRSTKENAKEGMKVDG